MALKGLHRSPSTEFKPGFTPWNKGTTWKRKNLPGPRSEEWCKKISESKKGQPSWNKGISGEKSHSWKGGKSDLTARIRICFRYKKWVADVYRRDGWTCQTCGLRGHGRDIEAHHIKPLCEMLQGIEGENIDDKYILAMLIPELFDVNNGITLCKDCHVLTYTKKENKNEK